MSVFRTSDDNGSEPFVVKEKRIASTYLVCELAPGELVMSVQACGVSHISSKILNELFRKKPQPHYPGGWEVAGVVTRTGPDCWYHPGDRVAGLLPLDSSETGFGSFCLLDQHDTVLIPEEVGFCEAAAVIGDGLRAYTALYTQGRLAAGDTILVLEPAIHWCSLAAQLAHQWGAKVICVARSSRDKAFLENIRLPANDVIEVGRQTQILVSSVSEQTGGLGVDLIIDNGVCQFSSEENGNNAEDIKNGHALKHDIISCLGIGGRWLTSQSDLQLDPPDSQLLHMKSCTVGFVFEHSWTLARTQCGKYQHILRDIMSKTKSGVLRPHIARTVTMETLVEELNKLDSHREGKLVCQIEPS